ncbi:MAG: hypothetical protein K2K53_09710 [Oscillospiraceae bacterium]|nr:hypothetical protein [Oscillospiraceae bacterium]
MYGMNYSGGNNKTHNQIERADRIDSFEAGEVEGPGILFASRGDKILPLHCEHFTAHDLEERELVELSYPSSRWRCTLELTRVRSGFGGSRAFWLCPRCGRRSRYLYFKNRGFACRECAKLNYQSQQRTQDSINHFRDGMKFAREKLHWFPTLPIVPMDFPTYTPPKPPKMHRATYQRHLARFRQYQAAYRRDSLREMLANLRW